MSHQAENRPSLLNPLSTEIREGISLFTAVKDRTESLEEALQTWLLQPMIEEIIILDWDSRESLLPLVRKYQDGRIFLAVARNQPKWILSYACNLAARLTSRSCILKMDADVKVLPGFFEKHTLQPGLFHCGNWRKHRNVNELHLNGIVFLRREDFFRVNGYNEYIKFYGWDDSDLYQRLEAAGMERRDFDFDTLYHIPHGNRQQHQDKPHYLDGIPDEERATLATFTNRQLGNTFGKWSSDRSMLDFNVRASDPHTMECLQSGPDHNPVTPEQIMECETVAMRERLPMIGLNLTPEALAGFSRNELIEVYHLLFSAKTDPSARHLLNVLLKSHEIDKQTFDK